MMMMMRSSQSPTTAKRFVERKNDIEGTVNEKKNHTHGQCSKTGILQKNQQQYE